MPINSWELRSLIEQNSIKNRFNPVEITTHYALKIDDDVILADCSHGAITLSLYDPSTLPDNRFRCYIIYKMDSENLLAVRAPSGQRFIRGNTYITLSKAGTMLVVFSHRGDPWMSWDQTPCHLRLRRSSLWDSSNFSSEEAIPFDELVRNDNDSVYRWSSTDPAKITLLADGNYIAQFYAAYDNPDPSTQYAVFLRLYHNGNLVPSSELFSGKETIGSVSLSSIRLELSDVKAGDVIELRTEQINLDGVLLNALLDLKTKI